MIRRKKKNSALNLGDLAVLDEKKISVLYNFNNTKYQTYKKKFGLSNYDFQLIIKRWNGTGYGVNYSIGAKPVDAPIVVRADRFALIGDSRAEVTIKVWEK